MTWDKAMSIGSEVFEEVRRATEMFPTWPSYRTPEGRIEQAAIIAEESGEVVKEALNSRSNDPHFESYGKSLRLMRKELVQTAAMAMRALMAFPTAKEIDDIRKREVEGGYI